MEMVVQQVKEAMKPIFAQLQFTSKLSQTEFCPCSSLSQDDQQPSQQTLTYSCLTCFFGWPITFFFGWFLCLTVMMPK